MADIDGSSTVVEPNAPAGAAGMEQQESVLPENNQSTGEDTQQSEGSTSPGWMAQLPNDLRNNVDLQKFPTLGEFIRSTQSTGSDGKEVEGDQKPKETEPVKYEKFEKVLDQNADPFGTIGNSVKEVLEASQVPQEVAEKLFDSLNQAQDGSTKELIEKGKDWCEAQLRKDWGKDYEENRKAMSRAYVALVGEDKDLATALDRTGASINPAVAELLSRIGKSIREDGSIVSNRTSGPSQRSSGVPVKYPKS